MALVRVGWIRGRVVSEMIRVEEKPLKSAGLLSYAPPGNLFNKTINSTKTGSQHFDEPKVNLREAAKKISVFLGDLSQICLPTHPRVFMRFGKTKGEIWVKKGDFRSNLGGVLRGLNLVWESATPPTHIWERYPKKMFFLYLP